MEVLGYVILAFVALAWLVGMIVGMIVAFPYGILGLLVLLGIGLLLTKAIMERASNKEDDYYARKIDK